MIGSASGLVDRDRELAVIEELLETAGRGRGAAVSIEGPAGIGKTALIGAGRESAAGTGLRAIQARASELERDFAFGVVRQLFEPLAAEHGAALLAGAAAPARRIVTAQVERPEGSEGEGLFGALHALYWLTANAASQMPLLLCLDDLQWADRPSLRFLAYLIKRIDDLPAAVLMSLRTGEPGTPDELLDEVRFDPIVRRIEPGPLSPDGVGVVVRGDFPAASPEVDEACRAASGGNPFYLRELLRGLAIEGAQPDPETVARIAVPSVGERVLRRIERLGAEAVALARAMALLGDGESLAVARSLAGLKAPVANSAAAALVRVEVLTSEDPFAFVHPLVRRSVYASLAAGERDRGHLAAAGLLESSGASLDEIAAHLLITAPSGSDELARTLRRAAAWAMARAAPEAAVRYLDRALREDLGDATRVQILRELAQAEGHLWDEAAVEHLAAARALCCDPVERGRIGLQLGRTLMSVYRFEPAAAELLRAFGDVPDTMRELRDEIQAELLYMACFSLDTLSAGVPGLMALPDNPPAGPVGHALLSMKAGALAWADGPAHEVALLARRAIDGGLPSLSYDHATGALIGLYLVDEYEALARYCSRLLEVAERRGYRHELAGMHWQRAQLALARGDLAEAEVESEIEEKLVEGVPLAPLARSLSNAVSASTFREQGRLGEAEAMLDRIPELAQLPVSEWPRDWGAFRLLAARAQLRLLQGRAAEALSDCRRIASELEGREYSFPAADHLESVAALGLRAGGEHERAHALAQRELQRARLIGAPVTLGVALRAVGLIDDELDALEQSVARLAGSPARLEHAKSMLELGAALRRRNQRARARELLAEARELAHRCGAGTTEQRALEELRAAGSRPRRVMRSGVDSLTASELRVARMAAAGQSNTDIAQSLYISLKTVEMHLGRAYSKLDLSGRQARRLLAGALDEG